MENQAEFRFYAELNDFLPREWRQRSFSYAFRGVPAVKDTIEAIGVPHAEVELILVNGESVGFGYQLQSGDRVAVYPVFESLDVSEVIQVRPQPLRETRFVLDVHLGKLARLLRLLGFDARYRNDYEDPEIVELAREEHRIILTRDVGLLKHSEVTHGYWLRATDPLAQAREVVERFDLRDQARPFTRCLRCNGILQPIDKAAVADRLPPKVAREHEIFYQCRSCDQVYWCGSHFRRLQQKVERILGSP